jgi:hypothetical protein
MSTRATRIVLAVLAATAAFVGLWAVSAPLSFYTSFPGGGHRWIAADGPYNEHLIRDVGGLYLALLALIVGAIVHPTPQITRLTGVAWLVFSIPHLVYHAWPGWARASSSASSCRCRAEVIQREMNGC